MMHGILNQANHESWSDHILLCTLTTCLKQSTKFRFFSILYGINSVVLLFSITVTTFMGQYLVTTYLINPRDKPSHQTAHHHALQ
jgi:hypothetical protein